MFNLEASLSRGLLLWQSISYQRDTTPSKDSLMKTGRCFGQ